MLYPVKKVMSEISKCCHYFSSNPCIKEKRNYRNDHFNMNFLFNPLIL